MSVKRIAMWSGPRNLSTAMMYAFAQRADCAVIDEPFYGVYLRQAGFNHPMREDVLAAMPQDAARIVDDLTQSSPAPVHYQKHMCQHMLPDVPRCWMADVINVFLIRHPSRVIASFSQKIEDLTEEDIGFAAQAELYEYCLSMGQTPIVIDSFDIRANPEAMLRKLCEALDLGFDPAMLSWPEGGNAADGIWAKVWYGAVHRSTGFAGAEGDLPVLDGSKAALAKAASSQYHRLKDVALRP